MTRLEPLSFVLVALTSMGACKGEPEPAAAPPPAATPEPASPDPAAPEPANPDPDTTDPKAAPTKPATTAEPAAAEVEAEVVEVVQALGNEGAAVVVLRPRHWAALRDALVPWLKTASNEASMLADMLGEPSGPRKLGARWLDLESVPLEGWDETRSVVISFGEVPYDGPPGSVTPRLPTTEQWLPPVRHQIWLPARDPAALMTALDATLSSRGIALPALVEGREGAVAIEGDEWTAALLPQPGAVRVVVFQGAFGRDDAVLLDHMRRHLDATPHAVMPTPAQALLARPDAVVSALMRPWRVRPFAAWSACQQTLRAISTVSEEWRQTAMARGLQIVLDTELLMTDEGAEVDDSVQSLVVDDGVLRLRTAMSLTPKGESILTAATRGAGQVLAAPVTDAWIDVAVQADARAMLETAGLPPAFERAKAAGDMARGIEEGGYFASLYMGLRYPVGLVHVIEQLAKTERLPMPIDVLPNAARVVWRGFGDQGPRVVMALGWPDDYVDLPLAGIVPVIKGEPGFESLRMDSIRRDGRPVTVFGLGGESASSLDAGEGSGTPGLVRARVSLARIGADLATRDPERAAWLTGAGEVLLTVEHRDRALLGELAWALGKAEVRAQAKPVPRLEHEAWSSPVGVPVSDGAKCLAQAGRAVAQALGATATVAADQKARVLASAVAEADEPLRCAEGHEDTAQAAKALRRMLGEAKR